MCTPDKSIYTVEEANPTVNCLVVDGAHFVAVGDLDDIQGPAHRLLSPVYRLLEIARLRRPLRIHHLKSGQIIVPGFADAHAHILEYGFKQNLVLDGSQSIEEVRSRIRQYILERPEVLSDTSIFISGMGWDQTKWPGGGVFPTADDLEEDSLLKDRPIVLRRVDGHAMWTSPKVLKMMNPIPETVEGGEIIRDSSGKPTGKFRFIITSSLSVFLDNAMELIPEPPWTETQMMEYYKTTMDHALAVGLTSIHDAFATPEFIAFLERHGRRTGTTAKYLFLRLYLMGGIKDDVYWGSRLTKRINYGVDGRLTLRSVKLVADGALGSWGAALLSPYSDDSSKTGFLLQSEEVLAALINRFFEDEWQTNVHCIGDRANHVVLDIFEELLQNYSVTETRPRIEHSQIFTLDDLQRIGKLGVIPSVQPTHATSDMWYAESRLGPDRIRGAYAYRTLSETSKKGPIAIGSDFPIEGINPLLGFYASVSRLSQEGTSPQGPGGWYPDEALTREQALRGMTLGASYASFSEDTVGSIYPGKRADFVILDQNIMSISLRNILETRVLATVIDGKFAYGDL
ncbi:amidohydrolase 3 [Sistotremastrum suecicum HHB10207 ss-3]|uniref:Amidohydrolase 3 n=1 Tax=Sistotremastrum suecicum HHB10207 ss-3 TaxID=1314776 RepID=A0A166BCZ9_9AGAM|nr:amidohydrolase 3 [Sistotremastrum suecicum HHB10207 ss-3]